MPGMNILTFGDYIGALGGSWGVLSGVISPLASAIVTLLLTPHITPHESPSCSMPKGPEVLDSCNTVLSYL